VLLRQVCNACCVRRIRGFLLTTTLLPMWLQVWELVPAALQDALGPLIGEKQGEVEANPEVKQLLRFSVADLSWLAGRQQREIQRWWCMCLVQAHHPRGSC
jgi:hypothetical protein